MQVKKNDVREFMVSITLPKNKVYLLVDISLELK